MSESQLHASKEKIKRAKAKFGNVKSLVNGYLNANPFQAIIQKGADCAYIIGRVDQPPPDDIHWEVVEAVGHLRSALDKAVVAMVASNGKGTSGIGFPFGGMGEDGKPYHFPDARTVKKFEKKLTPQQWAFIEAQRPYPGGNDALWGINEIANTDKHRENLVQIGADPTKLVRINRINPNLPASDSIVLAPQECDVILGDEKREVVVAIVKNRGFNLKVEYAAGGSVVFSDLAPVSGKNVLTTLNQQIRLTESIVDNLWPLLAP